MALPKCNHKMGKVKYIYLVPTASRYMVKKYGYAKATELALKKHLKPKK